MRWPSRLAINFGIDACFSCDLSAAVRWRRDLLQRHSPLFGAVPITGAHPLGAVQHLERRGIPVIVASPAESPAGQPCARFPWRFRKQWRGGTSLFCEDSSVMDSAIPEGQGLYDPANEHDACGVGFVAHIRGQKSHSIIEQGLLILKNLDHRGAVGADPLMGDGAGILIQIPDAFFREEMAKQGVTLPQPAITASAWSFCPRSRLPASPVRKKSSVRCAPSTRSFSAGATCRSIANCRCRPTVRAREPVIRQIFIGRGPDIMVTDALERKLYIIRRSAANAIQALGLKHSKEFYQPSMSARTIVYKACCWPIRSASTTPTSRIRAAFRRWRWFTSVSRPIPSRPGSSRPPVPHDCAQRRDQHPARQLQLDARARERHLVAAARVPIWKRSGR
jgi:hypothetical protein